MEYEIIEVESFGVVTEYVIIDRGNNEYTSMRKSTYDEMIAQQESLSD